MYIFRLMRDDNDLFFGTFTTLAAIANGVEQEIRAKQKIKDKSSMEFVHNTYYI